MNFDTFIAAIQWTQQQWNARVANGPTYQQLRARGNAYWLRLDLLNRQALENNVIRGFLNSQRWNCHLDDPGTANGIMIVNNLQQVLNRLPNGYGPLQNTRIEDPAMAQDPTMLAVADIYHEFLGIRPKWGRVPSSKLMHLALPDLFIMWDNAIIKEFRVPNETIPNLGRKRSYVAFLLLMHEYIQHIRATSPGGAGLTYPGLFQLVNQHCGYAAAPLPITRLLDIANYAVSAQGRGMAVPPALNGARCRECCERAQVRLRGLILYCQRCRPGQYPC
jgi:hypothetical protein